MKTLYVSDLDGTLLNDAGKLDKKGSTLLHTILDQGIPLTFASARSVFSMKEILGEIPMVLPVIGSNGALLTEFGSEEHLEIIHLGEEKVQRIITAGREAGMDAVLGEYGPKQSRIFYERAGNAGMEWCLEERIAAGDPRLRQIPDIEVCGSDEIVTITFIGRKEESAALEQAVLALYPQITSILYENTYTPGWFWLTLQDDAANKGAALKRLRRRYPEFDKVVAFGDNHNDLSMFAEADHSVAVENGADDLRAAADEVIGRSGDNAVLRYILEVESIKLNEK